ncbi:hypothetical protein QR680_006970 [Steinernema hermaphroditum]|uniref:Uncharacterized protein n=1 Tax=Steinernema hermaphroditum TaxID=289476 RepID=A0AA39LXD6_9BILA|nr:hypothetical protein QR680_006970 [Steinernema hermaphroditum]
MDSVPYSFCDDVATVMDDFSDVDLSQLSATEWRSWRSVFKQHKEKRKTIWIDAFSEDDKSVKYYAQGNVWIDSVRQEGVPLLRQRTPEAFSLEDLKKIDKKYVRISALRMEQNGTTHPHFFINQSAFKIAPWNDFISTVCGLPLWGIQRKGWYLYLNLDPRYHHVMDKLLKALEKHTIATLTLAYTGQQCEIFLQRQLQKGFMESLILIGRWPNADHLTSSIKNFFRSPNGNSCTVSDESALRGDFETFRILFDRFLDPQEKQSSLTLCISFSEETMRTIKGYRTDLQPNEEDSDEDVVATWEFARNASTASEFDPHSESQLPEFDPLSLGISEFTITRQPASGSRQLEPLDNQHDFPNQYYIQVDLL